MDGEAACRAARLGWEREAGTAVAGSPGWCGKLCALDQYCVPFPIYVRRRAPFDPKAGFAEVFGIAHRVFITNDERALAPLPDSADINLSKPVAQKAQQSTFPAATSSRTAIGW